MELSYIPGKDIDQDETMVFSFTKGHYLPVKFIIVAYKEEHDED